MCASSADVACMLPKSPPTSPPPPSPPPPAPPRTRNFEAANWEKFDNLYCDSYAYQGNQHVAFSSRQKKAHVSDRLFSIFCRLVTKPCYLQ